MTRCPLPAPSAPSTDLALTFRSHKIHSSPEMDGDMGEMNGDLVMLPARMGNEEDTSEYTETLPVSPP